MRTPEVNDRLICDADRKAWIILVGKVLCVYRVERTDGVDDMVVAKANLAWREEQGAWVLTHAARPFQL